jgi:hypothetical protein
MVSLMSKTFKKSKISMTCKMGYVRVSTTSSSYPLMERKERDTLQQSLGKGFQLSKGDIQWKMVSKTS